jgi:hypothetical protein
MTGGKDYLLENDAIFREFSQMPAPARAFQAASP